MLPRLRSPDVGIGRGGSKAKSRKPARTLLAHSLDPTLRFDLLKSSEDVDLQGKRAEYLQLAGSAATRAHSRPNSKSGAAGSAATPTTPAEWSEFYGYAGPKNGGKKIFLIKGEDIFLAKEGDIVDRRYKIVRVGTTSVEVQDVLTNHTETIPLGAG